ncbi:hypothetical protein ACLI1A_03390 [Flavobacterium sp. RHBU_3]|uniref:DUF7677 family protein n=1 Tax=Flavobacterium sp. RHBU_3 TaxID=3391184 RepID=UPI003984A1E6
MKLSDDIKTEIRCFVYFLFSGTVDSRLIKANFDYLELILKTPQLVFNCFKVFTSASYSGMPNTKTAVGDYIVALHYYPMEADDILNEAEGKLLTNKHDFWFSFLEFSEKFCFNNFSVPLANFDLYVDFYNVGSDALMPFIIWTNVVEIDENNQLLNKGYATRRANEILLSVFDGVKPDIPFSEEELDAEFY